MFYDKQILDKNGIELKLGDTVKDLDGALYAIIGFVNEDSQGGKRIVLCLENSDGKEEWGWHLPEQFEKYVFTNRMWLESLSDRELISVMCELADGGVCPHCDNCAWHNEAWLNAEHKDKND